MTHLHPCNGRTFVASKYLLLILSLGFAPGTKLMAQTANELSLATALQLAEQHSLALPAQVDRADSARELAIVSVQQPDPVLSLALDNVPTAGAERWSLGQDFMTMRSVGLAQTWVRKSKRDAMASTYEQQALLAESERRQRLNTLQIATAQAWFETMHREYFVHLLRDEHEQSLLLVSASEAAYSANTGTQTDVLLARAESIKLQASIIEAENNLHNARITLHRWVGDAAAAPLAAAPAITSSRLQQANLEELLQQQPAVAMLGQEEKLAQAELTASHSQRQSDWTVQMMYSQRGSAFENMVSVGVSVPLQLGHKNKQDRSINANLLLRDSARKEREELLREYLAQTRRTLSTWQSNLSRLAMYDNELLPLASDSHSAALTAYRSNEGTLSAVLNARRAEIALQQERLHLEMDTALLWTQLEFLIPPATSALEL